MKKTLSAPRQKPHRLSLNRETIRRLDDTALLRFAKGGGPNETATTSTTTQESTSGTLGSGFVPEIQAEG
jgi:hypothetical protein